MDDEIQDELDFQSFMAYLRHLQEEIFLAHMDLPTDAVVSEINDIRYFGNEPVFGGLIFDILEKENSEYSGG